MNIPLIGITAYPYVMPGHGWDYDICYRGNVRAVERAGGLPILIPAALDPKTLRALFDRVDVRSRCKQRFLLLHGFFRTIGVGSVGSLFLPALIRNCSGGSLRRATISAVR